MFSSFEYIVDWNNQYWKLIPIVISKTALYQSFGSYFYFVMEFGSYKKFPTPYP